MIKSYAKINLNLNILRLRNDSYHEIDSIFAKISLCDEIKLTEKKSGIEIRNIGKYKIPTNSENSMFQAAQLLQKYTNINKGLKIEINKKIPIQAGLGGGSSNAATVLQFLNKFWQLNLKKSELLQIAAQIGTDVYFFIKNNNFAKVTGIGEKISPISFPKEIFNNKITAANETKIMIVIPHYISISTPWAYAELKKYFQGNYPALNLQQNTFEKIIFQNFPDLKYIKNTFLENSALHSNLTGSGSAVFAVFSKKNDLSNLKKIMQEKGNIFTCEFL